MFDDKVNSEAFNKQLLAVYNTVAKSDFHADRAGLLHQLQAKHSNLGFNETTLGLAVTALKRGGYMYDSIGGGEISVTSKPLIVDEVIKILLAAKESQRRRWAAEDVVKENGLMSEPETVGGKWYPTKAGDKLIDEILTIKDKLTKYEAMVALNPDLSVTQQNPSETLDSKTVTISTHGKNDSPQL